VEPYCNDAKITLIIMNVHFSESADLVLFVNNRKYVQLHVLVSLSLIMFWTIWNRKKKSCLLNPYKCNICNCIILSDLRYEMQEQMIHFKPRNPLSYKHVHC